MLDGGSMRNIKAVVQYDGSRYYGFQAQLDPENLPTVQEELEAALQSGANTVEITATNVVLKIFPPMKFHA